MARKLLRRPGPWTLPMVVLFLGGALAFPPSRAEAENRCSATLTRGGKKFDLRNCAVAYHSSEWETG